jgi:hypothetical protein
MRVSSRGILPLQHAIAALLVGFQAVRKPSIAPIPGTQSSPSNLNTFVCRRMRPATPTLSTISLVEGFGQSFWVHRRCQLWKVPGIESEDLLQDVGLKDVRRQMRNDCCFVPADEMDSRVSKLESAKPPEVGVKCKSNIGCELMQERAANWMSDQYRMKGLTFDDEAWTHARGAIQLRKGHVWGNIADGARSSPWSWVEVPGRPPQNHDSLTHYPRQSLAYLWYPLLT